MTPQARRAGTVRKAAPKPKTRTTARRRAASKPRKGAAQRSRPAGQRKLTPSKVKGDGVVLKKSAQKRLDKLEEGVDHLVKVADRLNKQLKEMAASIADARAATSQGKTKQKRSK